MHFRRLSLALLTLLLTVSPVFSQGQKSAGVWTEWETITPEGEEFTVTMPKNPTTETSKFPYHKMELNTRLYLARSTAGPVLAVASFSGIKASPMYTEFARFNSYIDAFKDFFPPESSQQRQRDREAHACEQQALQWSHRPILQDDRRRVDRRRAGVCHTPSLLCDRLAQ